jgi:hypothetical protein
MKHYSEQEIALIKDKINLNIAKLNESVTWVEANLKHEEKHTLLLKLKNSLNTFKKVNANIDSKPVIAVFGGSQVGKSYLIKNLLSLEGQPFIIENNQIEYDFLKDINPPGVGAESTGVVTRFTINDEIRFREFPVKIKLLSPKDILIIILDSFFLDLKKITSFISSKDLEAHIDGFESSYVSHKQDKLSEYDILEIKEYFENHLSRHTILFEGLIDTRFFERVGKIIDGYTFQDWNNIFQVLWAKNVEMSKLFTKLIAGLEQLKFDSIAYLPFKEVLRGEGEILDVKRLKELNHSTEKITVKLDSESETIINRSLITALTAELVFSIPKELVDTKEFLANSDLLDFPGARSRLALEVLDIDAEIIPDMLLRGKVSYLFNKYSDDFNVNNLLFCTNDKQLDVNEIPSLLFNWISKNVGANFHERTLSLKEVSVPSLFVVFTFFNNQLKFDTTNDHEYERDYEKLDYKWDIRFNRFFANEIVTQTKDWHVNWTRETPNFNNFYLLRDFKYSADSFDGFEEFGYEVKLNEDRVTFLNKLKQSFLNFDFVKKHFESPQNSWESISNIKHDGSALIVQNLAQVSNNLTKTNHYINKLNVIIGAIKPELEKHLHSDDLSLLRTKKMKSVNDLQFSLNNLLSKDPNLFNQFMTLFSLEPVEIFNLLNENIVVDVNESGIQNLTQNNLLLSQYPKLQNARSNEDVFEILRENLWLPSNEDVEDFLLDKGITIESLFAKIEPISKPKFYTELILNHWNLKICNSTNFEYFINNGVTQNSLAFLTAHFSEIIENRKLRDKLERILNDIVSEINLNHGIEEFLAETFSLIINDIVINFDLNYLSNEEVEEVNNLPNTKHFKAIKTAPSNDSSVIENLFSNIIFESSSANFIVLEKYNRWIEYFRISLLVNCGFVNYDEQANNRLKATINGFSNLSLN